MKKVLFFVLFLMFLGTASVVAQVTVGLNEEPSPWSLLDIKQASDGSSSKALHIPRLTTALRDALTASEKTLTKGLVIYNTTTNCLEYWNLQKWVSLCAGQANISFTDPDGNDAGDITQPAFPADGDTRGPYVPVDEPDCVGQDPAYSFLVISGADFISVDLVNSATGQFTLTMNSNETATPRNAIVRIINNCTGEYKEFVFPQNGNDADCGTTTSIPDILNANGTSLCTSGAVYLYLDGTPSTGTYIWTLGEVEKGRGVSLVATVPGTYKVYADLLGCTSVTPKTITVTGGGGSAPAPVSIIVGQNNGLVCSEAATTQLFASAASGGSIVWYKDGVKEAGKTGNTIEAGIGSWFAVVEDGGCSSTPSNTVTVSLDPNAGSAIPTPEFTINGASGDIILCLGGSLSLVVTNPQPSVTYTWLVNNTEVGAGTSYTMSMSDITSDFVLQCRATGGSCSSAGVSQVSISLDSAPSQPNITVNTPGDAVCDGTATLSAQVDGSPASYIWYRSDSQNGAYSVVAGETGSTLVISQTGWFKVAAQNGNCVSEPSSAKGITVSTGAATATISGDQSGIKAGETWTYTATLNNSQGASYSWSVDPGTTGATPTSGTGSSIVLRFSAAGTAIISLSAANACGEAMVSNNNYSVEVSNACATTGIISHSPATRAVTVTQGKISSNLSITATGGGTLAYVWYQNTTPTAGSGSTVGGNSNTLAIPTTLTAGTYYFSCVVTASCDDATATSQVFTVTVNSDPSTIAPAPSGSGTLSGKTCFDVVLTEGGTECGTLANRSSQKADFSQASTYTQQYTFAPTGSVTNVSFVCVEDAAYTGQIVQSVSYVGNVATVTYKDVNELARTRTRSNPLKVTVYAIFNVGASQYQIPLVVSIMDCQCCPGYFAQGGEYAPGNTDSYLNIPDYTSFSTLTNSGGSWRFAKTGKDLCYYKTDANNGGTNNWSTTRDGCGGRSTSWHNGAAGWRVPNIAELGVLESIYSKLSSQASSAPGTTNMSKAKYWSSTPSSGSTSMEWRMGNGDAQQAADSQKQKARCVMVQ
ncbi:hypothetical protein FACS189451_02420 [Bacteroidia bacterium]|nr:hypothetical protein FACS189451_02420 [Bacteroidia bacterium]